MKSFSLKEFIAVLALITAIFAVNVFIPGCSGIQVKREAAVPVVPVIQIVLESQGISADRLIGQVSAIIQDEIDGQKFNKEEVIAYVAGLIVAVDEPDLTYAKVFTEMRRLYELYVKDQTPSVTSALLYGVFYSSVDTLLELNILVTDSDRKIMHKIIAGVSTLVLIAE